MYNMKFKVLPFPGMAPYSGTMFFAYEVLDVLGVVFRDPQSPMTAFVKGCLASTFASAVSYPFDTIRKKMQVCMLFVTVMSH